MTLPVRVVVVDDSPLLRDLLVGYLEDQPGLEVVRTFADTSSLLAAVVQARPHAVVLDNQMPGGDGVDALPVLRALCPDVRIVMWSSDLAVAPLALALGADGFVGKQASLAAVAAEAAARGA